VHGTLNHLLVGDRIWMHRFTGEGPSPTKLDAILHEDFAELRAAREAEDDRIAAYVASLEPADLDGTIPIARSAIRRISSSSFAPRSCISSTTRLTIAVRRIAS
jgi:uncharacterized damage-inducible protein DinB